MLALIGLHHYSRFSISTGNIGGGGSYPLTGETELKEITATFALESDHINYITIEDENGNTQTLEVTDVHPFWVVTDEPDLERAAQGMIDENGAILHHNNIAPTEHGFWVEAKDLREGDVFLGANGELSTVVSVERVEFPDGIAVYNLTVDGNHNYFVIAACDEFGQTSVLVHNAGYGDSSNPPLWFSGAAYGLVRVGQGFIAPIRWSGLTELVGVENYLKESDRAVQLLHDTLWPEPNALSFGTEVAANTAVASAYAAFLSGSVIRGIGDKTFPSTQWGNILRQNPGFDKLSSYDKGIWLLKNQPVTAILPNSKGVMLGTTSKYPVWTHHLPSVETIIIGTPFATGFGYWVHDYYNLHFPQPDPLPTPLFPPPQ